MKKTSLFNLFVIAVFLFQSFEIKAQEFENSKDNPNLNCVEEKDKKGNILSEGCYYLQNDKTWAKHGTWLHYNKEGILIDSINYAHGLLVDIRKTYDDERNLIELIDYGKESFPRTIKHTEYKTKGASRVITTSYKQIKKDSVIKHGVLISQWKNGNIKDSVVYEDGIKKFWAGFYKTGELEFTSDFGLNPRKGSQIKTTEYDKDGSVRSTRTEYAGYDISLY
jgi:antitoxin component YwqK of YwqJK toxin-antitoxin module